MTKGHVCVRPWGIWRAALILLLIAFSPLAAGAAGPFPFEDVDDNGVFDGNDKDISAVFDTTEFIYFKTPHSIVIPAGAPLTSPEKWAGFYLESGKNITVNASMMSPAYAGLVDLRAMSGRVTIGAGVVLNGRDYVSLQARDDVVLGARASIVSRGVSANFGTLHIRSAAGDVILGSNVKLTTLRDIFVTAVAGDIAVGPGLKLDVTNGILFANGDRITINDGRLRADGLSLTADGPVEFKNNRVTIPKSGSIFIYSPRSTVDLTGSTLPKVDVHIEATRILN